MQFYTYFDACIGWALWKMRLQRLISFPDAQIHITSCNFIHIALNCTFPAQKFCHFTFIHFGCSFPQKSSFSFISPCIQLPEFSVLILNSLHSSANPFVPLLSKSFPLPGNKSVWDHIVPTFNDFSNSARNFWCLPPLRWNSSFTRIVIDSILGVHWFLRFSLARRQQHFRDFKTILSVRKLENTMCILLRNSSYG